MQKSALHPPRLSRAGAQPAEREADVARTAAQFRLNYQIGSSQTTFEGALGSSPGMELPSTLLLLLGAPTTAITSKKKNQNRARTTTTKTATTATRIAPTTTTTYYYCYYHSNDSNYNCNSNNKNYSYYKHHNHNKYNNNNNCNCSSNNKSVSTRSSWK